eukprot:10132947-Alexandrium_andersonii.AAC.1
MSPDDAVRIPEGWCLMLKRAKRGFEQRGLITDPRATQWLDRYVASLRPPCARLFPISYSAFRRRLLRLAQ